MNKQQIKYMLEDMKIGLKRNMGSTIASISLLFIAVSLVAAVLLTRLFITDVVDYVESQLAMKVYVEVGLAEQVADVLSNQSYAAHVTVEKGDELIEQLAFFFVGKEHLLEAFTDGSVPDAVKFRVTAVSYMQSIADNLAVTDGILHVVYPQQMAEKLMHVVQQVERYGYIASVVFTLLAFFIVYMTSALAMYKREQELKVKLLLGMNPKHVRYQFLLEGAVIGVMSSALSLVVTALLYTKGFLAIQEAFPYIGQLATRDVFIVIGIQLIMSLVIAVSASYLSTRKWVRHV